MDTIPVGPRRVNELRRVTVPKRQARALGIAPGSWVLIGVDSRDAATLVIKAAEPEVQDHSVSDTRRLRRVSDTGQVTLPAALLARAGIDVGDWVAFTSTRAVLRVFHAHRVRGPQRVAS